MLKHEGRGGGVLLDGLREAAMEVNFEIEYSTGRESRQESSCSDPSADWAWPIRLELLLALTEDANPQGC